MVAQSTEASVAELTEREIECGRRIAAAMFGLGKQQASLGARISKVGGFDRSAVILLKTLVALGPTRSSALAAAIHSDPSTVSRQVAALVGRGLLERRADQLDGPDQPQALNLSRQLRPQDAGANDPAMKRPAALRQKRARLDQIAEPFLLDEPANGHNHRRSIAGRAIRKFFQIQAVVNPPDLVCQGAKGLAEIIEMHVANGDHCGGVAQFPPEVVGFNVLMKDVFGAGRSNL